MTESEKAFTETDPAKIGTIRYLVHISNLAKRILKMADCISGGCCPTTADGLKAVELAIMLDRAQSGGATLDKIIEEVKAEQERTKAAAGESCR